MEILGAQLAQVDISTFANLINAFAVTAGVIFAAGLGADVQPQQ